jgi:hypothetical protein
MWNSNVESYAEAKRENTGAAAAEASRQRHLYPPRCMGQEKGKLGGHQIVGMQT